LLALDRVAEKRSNVEVLQRRREDIEKSLLTALTSLAGAATAVDAAIATVELVRTELGEAQLKQSAEFTELQKVHQQADERSRARLELQQRVAKLGETEAEQVGEKQTLVQLLESRGTHARSR
jgi:tRNA U55 pseudouridine synthase TruB